MGGNYEKSIYNQLLEVMARLDSVEKDLKEEKTEHKEDVKRLEKIIDEQDRTINTLKNDNARLKAIINNDSSNSSLPPSSDQKGGKPANTYNGRSKTSRKAGGQKGHSGTTLTKADVEEKIRTGACRHEIKTLGEPSMGKCITKYIVDLNTEAVITELRIYADTQGNFHIPPQYRSDVTYGENVKALAVSLYSEGVMSNERIAAFLNAAGNGVLGLSDGSVYGFCRKMARNASESIRQLEEELSNQGVVATDATTITVNGIQNYIRNFSTGNAVIYHAMESKSIESLKKIGFLNRYSGTLVHDHETALYHFGTEHAECNVHIIRYLRKNTEETENKWSEEMITLLSEMNQARKKKQEMGICSFTGKELADYEERYYALIQKGRTENKMTTHKYARSDETTLLNRLEKYGHNHLLFLHDFAIPFENNISERDLRKAKNRQKMSGGFRKESGHQMYCAILTILETLKRRNMGIIENLKKFFIGAPAIF